MTQHLPCTLSAAVEPDSRPQLTGWRRAIPLASSAFFMATSVGGLGLVVQLYMKSLGASTFLIGLSMTLNSVGLLFGAWLWGTVSDHVKRLIPSSRREKTGTLLATRPSP